MIGPRTLLISALMGLSALRLCADVHFGNGIKTGEVDAHSAIIWTRLTKTPERRADGIPFQAGDDKVPAGRTLADMKDSLVGARGEVRVLYQTADGPPLETAWQAVDAARDCTAHVRLSDLQAGTQYSVTVEGRAAGGQGITNTCKGTFSTAPLTSSIAPVRFVVGTCAEFPGRDDGDRGHLIYPSMKRLDPAFFIHTGDIEYYDRPGPWSRNGELARFKWNRLFSLENQRDFHRTVPSYFMKDDHDTLKNDCWPGQSFGDITWEQGLALFREQFPLGDKPYRTVRWGKDVQVWMVEGREFRSPNNMPDGPEKSILGAEQKKWLMDTMRASDASFRILVSATPVVGPDRGGKNDNHANKGFTYEGDELRAFLASLPNAFVICGDRHWQYVTRDAKTGLTEFSVGPGSDSHAGGFSMNLRGPEHRFLRIAGGFLSVEAKRENSKPRILFRHHDVKGTVMHEENF